MKKILILAILLCSCSNYLNANEILSHFNEKNDITTNEYYIGYDYGTYSQARVIQINNDYGMYVIVCEKIEDLEFTYPQKSHNIDVLYEGEFYTLTSAYEEEILSYKDLEKIHKKHLKFIENLDIEGKGTIVKF